MRHASMILPVRPTSHGVVSEGIFVQPPRTQGKRGGRTADNADNIVAGGCAAVEPGLIGR